MMRHGKKQAGPPLPAERVEVSAAWIYRVKLLHLLDCLNCYIYCGTEQQHEWFDQVHKALWGHLVADVERRVSQNQAKT